MLDRIYKKIFNFKAKFEKNNKRLKIFKDRLKIK